MAEVGKATHSATLANVWLHGLGATVVQAAASAIMEDSTMSSCKANNHALVPQTAGLYESSSRKASENGYSTVNKNELEDEDRGEQNCNETNYESTSASGQDGSFGIDDSESDVEEGCYTCQEKETEFVLRRKLPRILQSSEDRGRADETRIR